MLRKELQKLQLKSVFGSRKCKKKVFIICLIIFLFMSLFTNIYVYCICILYEREGGRDQCGVGVHPDPQKAVQYLQSAFKIRGKRTKAKKIKFIGGGKV